MLNLGGGYKLYLQTLEMIRTFKEVWGLIGTSQSYLALTSYTAVHFYLV